LLAADAAHVPATRVPAARSLSRDARGALFLSSAPRASAAACGGEDVLFGGDDTAGMQPRHWHSMSRFTVKRSPTKNAFTNMNMAGLP